MGKNGCRMVTETRWTEKVLPEEKSEVVAADGTYSSSARNRGHQKVVRRLAELRKALFEVREIKFLDL